MIQEKPFKNYRLNDTKIQKLLIFFLSILILFLIDIFTKYYFTGKKYFEGNFIYINSTSNAGSAFSMFSNVSYYSLIIAICGVLFIGILIYHLYSINYNNIQAKELDNIFLIVFIFIIAGVLGNTYDRFVFGFTRDFIGINNFFIFNVADFYLTSSVIIYIYYELKTNFKHN